MRGTLIARRSPARPAITASSSLASAAPTSCSMVTDGLVRTALPPPDAAASVLGVLLRDDGEHRVGVGRRQQAAAELGVLEDPADAGQRLEVGAGRGLG